MDPRDKYNIHEKVLLEKNREDILIINNYMPEGVPTPPDPSQECVDFTKTAHINNPEEDKTITKKERHLKLIISVAIVVGCLFFFWIMATKDKAPRKKSVQLSDEQTEKMTQTESKTITSTDIENTITGSNPNQNMTTQGPEDKKDFKLGDKVSYKNKTGSNGLSKDRNYNTPLYIKADQSSLGVGNGIRAAKLPLPANSYVRAYLEREISAENYNIPVTAICYADMTYNGKVLIPSGSKLIGQTGRASGNRVGVSFSNVVFPNGNEYSVSGVALGDDNGGGIAGNVDYKMGKKSSSIFASSLLDAASSTLSISGNSFGTNFAGSMADNTSNTIDDSISYSDRNNKISVFVPMNTRFKVLF